MPVEIDRSVLGDAFVTRCEIYFFFLVAFLAVVFFAAFFLAGIRITSSWPRLGGI